MRSSHLTAAGSDAVRVMVDEKTPLLDTSQRDEQDLDKSRAHQYTSIKEEQSQQLSSLFIGALRAVVSTLLAPGYYIVACFYDEHGRFSAFMPLRHTARALTRKPKRSSGKQTAKMASSSGAVEKTRDHTRRETDPTMDLSAAGSEDSPSKHTRSQSSSSTGSDDSDMSRPRRAIRIKTLSDQAFRDRDRRANDPSKQPTLTVDTIKSPTNATNASKILKYPRAPAPPRPLVPKRQPSYSLPGTSPAGPQKTLVIDLDETLIHSMAKGGRMSTGHMVEVKLQTPVGIGGNVVGPQVPILYWVNKRPHCDEFLRKISKWYNLVIFTASVQEYADPVIDWLELERKYFSARYYRQHCTFRNGAYIKDLSHVEPDLSRVMILDNSPMSYVFHEDNAIPIEGWISDPTDNDLLHLLPLLEALQYTTDVRSLLALRLGEANSN